MSVTIRVNGLTITHKGSGGQHQNSSPDVCKTPGSGVPVPYAITAFNPDIVKGTTTVHADGGHMIAHRTSEFSRCTGDEAGSMGGVVSGTFTKQSNWITWSPDVFMEGKNVCRKTDKLFMNNRNCISGQGGQGEVPIPGGDVVLNALCDIFCEAREEWQRCKAATPPRTCPRPSTLARDKARAALGRAGSPLRNAIQRRIPGGVGAAERSIYTLGNRARDLGRKFYDQQALRDSLERAVRRAIRDAGVDALQRMGRRWWMRMVPGLNLLGGALDIIDGAMAAADIYNAIRSVDTLMNDAVRIVPDFTVLNPDGSVAEIYDFKFDAPGYQDVMPEDQRRLYSQNTDKPPVTVDNATCNCDARRGPPSLPSS
jgi:hypothetical protein